MKKKLNIRDIAKIAGVSPMTVSRALSDQPSNKISEATRNKVLKVCAELRYHPNEHFRRVNSQKANTIALIFSELERSSNGGFETYADLNLSGCIRGAQDFLSNHDINLLLMEATPRFLELKQYIKMIRGQLLDGILLWGMIDDYSWITELADEEIPIVMMQTESAKIDCGKVVSDDYGAMNTLVEKALNAGHRKFLLITPELTNSISQLCYDAVIDTLGKYDLKLYAEIISPKGNFTDGEDAAEIILKKYPETTCIISARLCPAYGVISGLEKAGVVVPDDISVIGCGLSLSGISPCLTSYTYDSLQVGSTAAEHLLHIINGEQKAERIIVPPILTEGKTLTKCVQNRRKVKCQA